MENIIYYFSGTGNSLAIARHLALELGSSQVVALAKLMQEKEVRPEARRVAIVYPVYAMGPPLIVVDFISKLKISPKQYLFIIANYAMMQGAGISKIERMLKRRNLNLKAAFGILMPGNYTPFYEACAEAKQKSLFDKEKIKIKDIAQSVKKDQKIKYETGFFLPRWLLWEPICALAAKMMPKEDKNFWVTDKCNACGLCAAICPVGNIKLTAKKPTWHHKCQQCFACFHWCPKTAIEYGRNTLNRKRYKHPEATPEDIKPFSATNQ